MEDIKRGRGRPTKFTTKTIELATEKIQSGKTISQTAREMEVTRQCLYVWASKNPELKTTLSKVVKKGQPA